MNLKYLSSIDKYAIIAWPIIIPPVMDAVKRFESVDPEKAYGDEVLQLVKIGFIYLRAVCRIRAGRLDCERELINENAPGFKVEYWGTKPPEKVLVGVPLERANVAYDLVRERLLNGEALYFLKNQNWNSEYSLKIDDSRDVLVFNPHENCLEVYTLRPQPKKDRTPEADSSLPVSSSDLTAWLKRFNTVPPKNKR